MNYGYCGKILHVDLTHLTYSVETPSDSFYRKYAGGSALGLYYLLRGMPAGADPLGPDNVLCLALGPVTGAPISGQSRMMATAKSPLTGAIGDSQSGGYFPAEMKFAGYDALVVCGRAPHPVYLWIRDGAVELREARHLWGLDTHAVETRLHQELGDPNLQVAQCGISGEKRVRFAAIIHRASRANGRTGMGAVMGSKNLKAVVVRGTRGAKALAWADPQRIGELARRGIPQIATNPAMAGLARYGTAGGVAFQNLIGSLPTNNYDRGMFDEWERLTGETMYDTVLRGAAEGRQNTRGRESCYACAVRCKRVAETEYNGEAVRPAFGGPEYETVATFGSYCGIGDLKPVALASQLCNQYGADTISAGATVAFAMDCFEHGLLTREDTGGLDLRFGNADAMLALLKQILTRSTPLGDLLAEGSATAADALGPAAQDLALTVKRQELPAHMPQAKRSLALIYAVNPFGADHQSSEHEGYSEEGGASVCAQSRLNESGVYDPASVRSLGPEKIRLALRTEHFYSAVDSIGLCQFVFGRAWQLYGPEQAAELVAAATGWSYTLQELMQLGEMRLNLMRAFNAREGIDRIQDTLPNKLYRPLKGGATDGVKMDPAEIERALDLYYQMSGWEVGTGVPGRAKLAQLGVEWAAG